VSLQDLDAVVINGAGHDEFIVPMLRAADRTELPLLRPADGVPTLPAEGAAQGKANSHTFLSITGATQQIYHLARDLGALDPAHAELYQANARAYAKRLRWLLARVLSAIGNLDLTDVRIATVRDGYAYLFQELGLEVTAVIQPRHGIEPSPGQLADTVDPLEAARVDLLFTETDFPRKVVGVVLEETGVRLFTLTHISTGPYTVEKFESAMARNYASIHRALQALTESRR
jgi:zinc transport system substrate-binding protein